MFININMFNVKYSRSSIYVLLILLFKVIIIQSSYGVDNPSALYQAPQDLEVSMQHNISLEINPTGQRSSIEFLNINSFYIPEDLGEYQRILSSSSDYEELISQKKQKSVIYNQYQFREEDLTSNVVEISTNYEIQSQPHFPKIYTKQEYPIVERSDEQFVPYLEFADKINTNDKLQQKAFELARGEDDVYVIASKVANWVQQEIEYDLSTIFENPEQRATEVFESRQGVCTELSVIFASMMRTLGIPTKITTGYAYTTSEEIIDLVGSNWGGHAWTEVYINGKWVPFDLTYQQYGFVDSSHLILQRNSKIEELGVQVEMSAFNYEIVPNSLQSDFDFTILSMEEMSSSFENVEATMSINENVLSSGSHVLIEATIENTQDYYQTVPFDIIFPQEMSAKTPTKYVLPLEPNEQRDIHFILQLPEDMDGFSFPIALYTRFNNVEQVIVSTSSNAQSFTYEELAELLPEEEPSGAQESDDELDNVVENSNITREVEDTTNDEEESSELNTSYLEDVDFSSVCNLIQEDFDFFLSCNISQFSNNEDILSTELCSLEDCSSVVFSSESNSQNITVKTGYSPTFTMKANVRGSYEEEEFTIDLPEPKSLKMTYEAGDGFLEVRSQMDESDIFHLIEVEVANAVLRLDNTKQRQIINLEPGVYTMQITYDYFNQEVDSQEIEIEITQSQSLLDKIKKFFTSLFS
ncbi:MAG: transglutaminase-like domain-containing protein [Candidatus Nanoarchaeia archaeon]